MVSVSYMLHGRIRTIPGHGEELAAILPIIDRDSMTSQRLTAIAGIPD